MVREFRLSSPKETGGVLFGYWLEESQGVVITEAVGPGPRSKHDEFSFVPDWEYHETEIARLYEESGRIHTYLGDWHSHPHSTTRLSLTDRRTLSKIAKYAEARVSAPLMAVIADPDPPKVQVWQYVQGRIWGIRRNKIIALRLRQFS
jgi:integrative and conjugative element protein (TIGR02256 family)